MPESNQKEFRKLWDSIQRQLAAIPNPESRLGLKLSACRILADRYPEDAKRIYSTIHEEKSVPLVAGHLSDPYFRIAGLAVRTIPDILKAPDKERKVEVLIRAITALPSLIDQISLLADAATRFLLAGAKQQFDDMAARVIELIDSEETYQSYLVFLAGPVIFEYNRSMFEDKLSKVGFLEADGILMRVAKYALSMRSPDDPVDMDASHPPLDFAWAEKCCWLIERMSTDGALVSYLGFLIDRLVKRIDKDSERTNLPERQVLPLAQRLSQAVDRKLPDPNNIKHDGYKILALSHLCRLRHAAEKHKPFRSEHWERLCPSFPDIAQAARGIPNLADRPFVLIEVGYDWYWSNQAAGTALLNEASDMIVQIGDNLDRAGRYTALAQRFLHISSYNSARYFLEKAIESIAHASQDYEYRVSLESIIEVAHKISPEFASSLASKVDSLPLHQYGLDRTRVLSLRSNPAGISSSTELTQGRIIRGAAGAIMSSLCSGHAGTVHDEVIGGWIQRAQGKGFWTMYSVLEWYIENAVCRTKLSAISSLDAVFGGIMSILHMMAPLGEIAVGAGGCRIGASEPPESVPIWTFSPGQRSQMMEKIQTFIHEFGYPYVKIYDPYFGPSDLDILKAIPLDSQVIIVTETQRGSRKSEMDFRVAWREICDTVPPPTEIYVYGTKEGKSPMHDRFMVCEKKGLFIGTSVNSFGRSYTTVRVLNEDEKAKVENDIIDNILFHPPTYYDGERLIRRVFTLSEQ